MARDGLESDRRLSTSRPSGRRELMGNGVRVNGHALRIDAGRPSVDEAYERVVGEFLATSSLDRDEAFAALVAKRFREYPARVCSKAIGDWIDRRLVEAGWTQQ